MSQVYTLVTVSYDGGKERYEALYSRGRLIAQAEDGGFSAFEVLEALAADNIGVPVEYVELDTKYDQEVIADHGWPKDLGEIPQEARLHA